MSKEIKNLRFVVFISSFVSIASLIIICLLVHQLGVGLTTHKVRVIDEYGRVLMVLTAQSGTASIAMNPPDEPEITLMELRPDSLLLSHYRRYGTIGNLYSYAYLDASVPMLNFQNQELQAHIALIEDDFWLRYTPDDSNGDGWLVDRSLTGYSVPQN